MGNTQSTGQVKGHTASYIPAIQDFKLNQDEKFKGSRILVVGSGCAGLGAAWHLNRSGYNVTLYEAANYFGGHACTVNAGGIDVDTGFMVYNNLNYPNLLAMFEELGIDGIETTMGFSVSMDDGKFEWCGETLAGLLATPSNIVNPNFYVMFNDIFRFNKAALALLDLPENHQSRFQTTREFLKSNRLSNSFANFYLIPMTAAIWSATSDDILNFPAITLFSFLRNHLLLQTSGHLNWRTPKNRSSEYVAKIISELGNRAILNKSVMSVARNTSSTSKPVSFTVTTHDGEVAEFDLVVFACHPDQALKILGSGATTVESAALSQFHYSTNDTYVHCDSSLMPKSKSAWTSWNYIGQSNVKDDRRPVFVTYWLNRLQHLKHSTDIFVSLNPSTPPAPDKIFKRIEYSHPQYTKDSVKAQRAVSQIQGLDGAYFCGAWMGFGFHEDGFRSGLEVAMMISGKPLPWVNKYGFQKMIPAPKSTLAESQDVSIFNGITSWYVKPLRKLLQWICKYQIQQFLKKGFSSGKLSFKIPGENSINFTGSRPSSYVSEAITVTVRKPWFWVRLGLEADLGMAKSYIAGEWEIENTGASSDGLTKLLLLLIDNMPNGKDRVSGGIDAGELVTAWVGSALNMLWYRLIMDNSIANSRSNIHAHYDLSNDLFINFLDKEHMMYSCAMFETELKYDPYDRNCQPKLVFKDSLESAQTRKIDELLARLEPISPNTSLLDIGFGWGGICIRAAEKYGCRVHGITLSEEQLAFATEKVRQRGLSHLITFEIVDYRVFAKRGNKFDRIVSCEMIEAVGHPYLGNFFECVDKLLHKEGIFVMQAITMPDSRYPVYHKSADFLNSIIFPGGCCPSVSALLNAMANNSTLHLENINNLNLHYAETLRQWRYRFNDALPRILELGFDDTFIRLWNLYLCYCEAGFQCQALNLQMLTFSRPSNPNMITKRSTRYIAQQYEVVNFKK